MANLYTAYVLWLCGGWFGAHHLYLGRICHGFAWFATGGGWLIGWLWDLIELRSYVDECNDVKSRIRQLDTNRVASCSTNRFVGQLLLGSWLGTLAVLAIHVFTSNPLFSACGAGIGVAWGVYVVGNIGLQRRDLVYIWLGAFSTAFVFIVVMQSYNGIVFAAIAATLVGNRSAKNRTSKPPHTMGHFLLWSSVFCALMALFLGNTVRHVLSTDLVVNGRRTNLGTIAYEYLTGAEHHLPDGDDVNWSRMDGESAKRKPTWQDYVASFVFDGWKEGNLHQPVWNAYAYTTLGLDPYASPSEIHQRCQKLMKETHPDRAGQQSQRRFISVRKACEIVDKWRQNQRQQ
uniref:DnaJ homolog subfamily C member 22 n=1 Tax=Plectus sambesii TaxID=2011161 RepID=A0A914VV41_9BILA